MTKVVVYMLIYNDQNAYVKKENERTYLSFIPEDNFWRKLNKICDFNSIREFLKKYSPIEDDHIKLFKCLLLKSYYKISTEDLLRKLDSDMTFKYFLGYDLTEIPSIEGFTIDSFANVSLGNHIEREELTEAIKASLKDNLKGRTADLFIMPSTYSLTSDLTIGQFAMIFIETIKKVVE